MFHSRCLNNEINRPHEKCLRMIFNDKISNFEELLNKDNTVSIHHNNIHVLAIDNNVSPDIMNEVFKLRNTPHFNYDIHRIFLQTQSIVSITDLNQHHI